MTAAICRFGELPNELTGGRALILSSTTPEWVDVPIDPPERNFTVLEADLTASLDGKLKGKARIAAGGETDGRPDSLHGTLRESL